MSRLGAIERLAPASTRHSRAAASGERPGAAAAGRGDPVQEFFLPDLCHPRMVLAVVLVSELLAVVFALARPAAAAAFLTDLARLSLFIQWLGLTSAGILCYARRALATLTVPVATAVIFGLTSLNTALISAVALWLGRQQAALGVATPLFPTDQWSFLLRNEGITVIVTALLLRYFFVAHQWRRHVRAEARSRLDALQARMRPHFLFNSMNTIAALTRTDPARAEAAVEDLADLLRATLRDSDRLLRVEEELELTQVYQRIEELRLGSRLKVVWDVRDVPMQARMPGLTIQPLLENAIHHGIEPLDAGGTVTISGRAENGHVVFTLTNPIAADSVSASEERPGNRQALDNLRERLRLAYGERGALDVARDGLLYVATVRIPVVEP